MQSAIFANKFVCTVYTNRSTNPILLKIDMHVRFTMMHVIKSRLLKIITGSCKFVQLAIFANILVSTVMTCVLTRFAENDIHVRFMMMHV